MKSYRPLFCSTLTILLLSSRMNAAVGADLFEKLGIGKAGSIVPVELPASVAALSQDQVVEGLKQALAKGVQQAVTELGKDGGFLTNLNVRIPMPEKLQTVDKTLRKLKQTRLADEFVATMNHAAEQATPLAASIFADAVKQMTVEDAKNILVGTNNAATQYFRRVTETNLYAKFHPIVKESTEKAGVTSAYKAMSDKVNAASSFGGFGFGKVLGTDAMDLDSYVTTKALDGLFMMIANEEKSIRENPAARTTELLGKVFGAVKK